MTKRALAKMAGESWESTIHITTRALACGLILKDGDQVSLYEDVRFGLTPKHRPTCPKCAVLLDQALEVAP